jgi:hypothetical protein
MTNVSTRVQINDFDPNGISHWYGRDHGGGPADERIWLELAGHHLITICLDPQNYDRARQIDALRTLAERALQLAAELEKGGTEKAAVPSP